MSPKYDVHRGGHVAGLPRLRGDYETSLAKRVGIATTVLPAARQAVTPLKIGKGLV